MRRSASLTAQLKAQSREGTSLHFENCAGGYFSTDQSHTLKVAGRTAEFFAGKNLFPLGDLARQSDWANAYGFGVMSSDEVADMLEPLTTYTVSFDAECVKVPSASTFCDWCPNPETGETEGCGELGLFCEHSGLGFALVPSDVSDSEYGLGLPYENGSPLIKMFVYKKLGEGEKYHGVVTFTTPDSLDGYTLQVLTNQYYYSHYQYPEIVYSTVSFTNIKIEEGEKETSYIPYGEDAVSAVLCVKAGSIIVCGENRTAVPCDLHEGDVWYPATGIVNRGDSMEKYTPCPLRAPAGDFTVTQEPLELEAHISATLLAKSDG